MPGSAARGSRDRRPGTRRRRARRRRRGDDAARPRRCRRRRRRRAGTRAAVRGRAGRRRTLASVRAGRAALGAPSAPQQHHEGEPARRPRATATGTSRSAVPAVAARSVSAAAPATTAEHRGRCRRRPAAGVRRRTPATSASSATAPMTLPMSTGLSAVPNVSIANSLSGRGAASTARLPTESERARHAVEQRGQPPRLAATAAAPARSPASRHRARRVRRDGLRVLGMGGVRRRPPPGWVSCGSARSRCERLLLEGLGSVHEREAADRPDDRQHLADHVSTGIVPLPRRSWW